MASMHSPSIQAEVSEDRRWPTERLRPVDLDTRPSLGKRASRTLARILITFCIGVAATLAWQSYGDAARQMIANSYPQLGWLAPQGAPIAQTAPNMVAPAAPAALSPELPPTRGNGGQSRRGTAKRGPASAPNWPPAASRWPFFFFFPPPPPPPFFFLGDIAKISAPPPRPAAPPARKLVPLTPPSDAPPVR